MNDIIRFAGFTGIAVLAGSAITAACGLWLSLISAERRPKQHKLAGGLTVAAALLTAVAGFVSQADDGRFQNVIEQKNEEIVRLNKELVDANRELARSVSVFQESSRLKDAEIIKLNERLVGLSEDLAGAVSGKGSYAYIAPMLTSKEADLVVIHVGKHPLYDVTLRVVDLAAVNELMKRPHTLDDLGKAELLFHLHNLSANASGHIAKIPLPSDRDQADYNLFFSARHGTWVQSLRFRRVAGEWVGAFRVFDERHQLKLKHVDPRFPRTKSGEGPW